MLTLLLACISADPQDTSGDSAPVDSGVSHVGDADTDTDADTDSDSDTDTDPDAEAAYQALYDPTILQEIHLTVDAAGLAALSVAPDTYVMAGVQIGKTVVDGVGVRLRGGEGFDSKPSFRVKFNEFDGARFATLERLDLDAMMDDPTQARLVVASNLWVDAGMVGPRASFARVYLNDAYLGLYTNLEVMDDRFADRAFAADPGGDFWEAQDSADITENGVQRFDLVSGPGDTQILANADALLNAADAVFAEVAPTVLDYPQYLEFWSWSVVLGCGGSYPYELNDFNLYVPPATGLLEWTGNGLDESFDSGLDWDAMRGNVGLRCLHDPTCRVDLWDGVDAALTVWPGLDPAGLADDLLVLTDTAVDEDPARPFTSNEVAAARAQFLVSLDTWPTRVRTWMGVRPSEP